MANEGPGGRAVAPARRLMPADFARMKRHGERIAMVTAYDAPSARLADEAGMDGVLVGDSAAMTVLGHDSTVPITVDEMLMLTRAVSRSVQRALVVADLPFGSFQVSNRAAVQSAVRFVKEGGAAAVKLEGAGRTLARVRAIVGAGIAVMGHIGLTPQSAVALGGYKPQGRTASEARRLRDEALALEQAGCFAIVLEAMPAEVAARVAEALVIPTIGIGAGASCDGQVLVWHDLLGLTTGHVPTFVKRYADLAQVTAAALEAYVSEVRTGAFPTEQHTYAMAPGERDALEAHLNAPPAAAPSPPRVPGRARRVRRGRPQSSSRPASGRGS
jgi:3-methyl-2-oxobutanoate hydroxymethyltransferase